MAEATGLDYWLQWQVLVCALIVFIPTIISLNLIIKTSRRQVKQQQLKSCDLWLPCWKNLHPKWLLLYRVIAFCFMALLLCQTVVSFGPFICFYYTQWTVALVLVYFAIGVIVSARGCWTYPKEPLANHADREMLVAKDYSDNAHESTTDIKVVGENSIHQEAGAFENLMQSIYHACGGAVMLTDLVFWFLLLPFGNDSLTMLLGLLHSANVVFLVLDSAFNNHPFPWSRFTYFVLWSCAYIISQWIIHFCGVVTWWPYPFLELDTPWAPAWYFGLALFHIPCYALYSLLIKAKDFILSRMFPRAFLRFYDKKKSLSSSFLYLNTTYSWYQRGSVFELNQYHGPSIRVLEIKP